VLPVIQTLFSKNDALSQDDSAPVHTAGTVQSLFEGELRHALWPAKSPNLNITEAVMRNIFLPPTSLKQLKHVLEEK
jgi:hypothetical protein